MPLCEPQSRESSVEAFSLVLGDGTAPHAGKQVLCPCRPPESFSLPIKNIWPNHLACGVCPL